MRLGSRGLDRKIIGGQGPRLSGFRVALPAAGLADPGHSGCSGAGGGQLVAACPRRSPQDLQVTQPCQRVPTEASGNPNGGGQTNQASHGESATLRRARILKMPSAKSLALRFGIFENLHISWRMSNLHEDEQDVQRPRRSVKHPHLSRNSDHESNAYSTNVLGL